MNPIVDAHVQELLPLLRRFRHGEYGIALGGAHAKGTEDDESDLDLYLFAREVLPGVERTRLCEEFSHEIESTVSWGDESEFVQAGTDFLFRGQRVECWLRNVDTISATIAECASGIVKQSLVTWTVMGFYNHCALSDLDKMLPVDDPYGILARWKAAVRTYPPRLQEAIIARHLGAARSGRTTSIT